MSYKIVFKHEDAMNKVHAIKQIDQIIKELHQLDYFLESKLPEFKPVNISIIDMIRELETTRASILNSLYKNGYIKINVDKGGLK